jgi:hypothetical protein
MPVRTSTTGRIPSEPALRCPPGFRILSGKSSLRERSDRALHAHSLACNHRRRRGKGYKKVERVRSEGQVLNGWLLKPLFVHEGEGNHLRVMSRRLAEEKGENRVRREVRESKARRWRVDDGVQEE